MTSSDADVISTRLCLVRIQGLLIPCSSLNWHRNHFPNRAYNRASCNSGFRWEPPFAWRRESRASYPDSRNPVLESMIRASHLVRITCICRPPLTVTYLGVWCGKLHRHRPRNLYPNLRHACTDSSRLARDAPPVSAPLRQSLSLNPSQSVGSLYQVPITPEARVVR